MGYAASDNYTAAVVTAYEARSIDVLCTLRTHATIQPVRTRVFDWVERAVRRLGVQGTSQVGVNRGHRKTINTEYFEWHADAKIVVTCNPSFWDGDYRLYEAMASGALVLVDEIHVPLARPFVDGVHLVVYDNHNASDLEAKLAYFLAHPREAAAIATHGLVHTLRYHRAVSRLDYILRTAHVQFATLRPHERARGGPVPPPPAVPYADTGLDIATSLVHEGHPAGWSVEGWHRQSRAPEAQARRPSHTQVAAEEAAAKANKTR